MTTPNGPWHINDVPPEEPEEVSETTGSVSRPWYTLCKLLMSCLLIVSALCSWLQRQRDWHVMQERLVLKQVETLEPFVETPSYVYFKVDGYRCYITKYIPVIDARVEAWGAKRGYSTVSKIHPLTGDPGVYIVLLHK